MASLESLRNLGPKSCAWLREIEVDTAEQLQSLGAVEVYARLRFRFGRHVTRNMLHALHGAVTATDWRRITAAEKLELDRAVEKRLYSSSAREDEL